MSTPENYLGLSCYNCFRPAPDDARKCEKCHETHCEACMSTGLNICWRCDGVVGAAVHQRNVALKEKV